MLCNKRCALFLLLLLPYFKFIVGVSMDERCSRHIQNKRNKSVLTELLYVFQLMTKPCLIFKNSGRLSTTIVNGIADNDRRISRV